VDDFGVPIDQSDDVRRQNTASVDTRRAPLAARLQAIYGNVNNVDAFIGAVAEAHAAGSELGELQRAIWTRQFQALRDGDRFFYGNDPGLTAIRNTYGIDFRRNLGDIIALNTDIPRTDMPFNIFFTHGDVKPASCSVNYTVNSQWPGAFNVNMKITNTGSVPIPAGWTLRFAFANGQQIYDLWNGSVAQDGNRAPVVNAAWNAAIAPGQTIDGVGFNATWNNVTNARPARFTLNTTTCAVT